MTVGASERERAVQVAGASVGIAAGLLGTVALLAWRIERRARHLEDAIDGVRERTHAIRDIPKANAALGRMTGELRRLRTGKADA